MYKATLKFDDPKFNDAEMLMCTTAVRNNPNHIELHKINEFCAMNDMKFDKRKNFFIPTYFHNVNTRATNYADIEFTDENGTAYVLANACIHLPSDIFIGYTDIGYIRFKASVWIHKKNSMMFKKTTAEFTMIPVKI